MASTVIQNGQRCGAQVTELHKASDIITMWHLLIMDHRYLPSQLEPRVEKASLLSLSDGSQSGTGGTKTECVGVNLWIIVQVMSHESSSSRCHCNSPCSEFEFTRNQPYQTCDGRIFVSRPDIRTRHPLDQAPQANLS